MISETLEAIATNIENAYDELETKGATLPANKNIENLADTIATIQTGGGGEITTENINMYKYQQLAEVNLSGGAIPTNTEFANAEVVLQTIYNKVMGGGNE